jgi:hypothetical protein
VAPEGLTLRELVEELFGFLPRGPAAGARSHVRILQARSEALRSVNAQKSVHGEQIFTVTLPEFGCFSAN